MYGDRALTLSEITSFKMTNTEIPKIECITYYLQLVWFPNKYD